MSPRPLAEGCRSSIVPHPTLPDVLCIELTGGAVALVDAEDLLLVARYRWHLYQHPDGLQYAVAHNRFAGRRFTIWLHRLITMVGPSRVVDHRDGNGLDCRKRNLRPCEHVQNLWNAKLSRANKTGVKGLFYDAARSPHWRARVSASGVRHGRRFHERAEAESWLLVKRAELHGEFARHA
jgi:hypothetical protein